MIKSSAAWEKDLSVSFATLITRLKIAVAIDIAIFVWPGTDGLG